MCTFRSQPVLIEIEITVRLPLLLSNKFVISLDLHIMQLTDCFNIYRTHLHGIEENKDKLQGIFDLHVSLCDSFYRMM